MDSKNITEFVPLFVSAFKQAGRTKGNGPNIEILDSKGILRGTIYMFIPDRLFYGGSIDWKWLGFDCGMECSDRMEFMKNLPVFLERREMYSFACGIIFH